MPLPEPPARRLLVAGLVLSAVSWPSAGIAVPDPSRDIADEVQELIRSGSADSALALVDAGVEEARAQGDERGETALLVQRGMILKYTAGGAAAESCLQDVLVRARDLGDCHVLCACLYHLAQAIDDQGRPPRARTVYEELLERATACDEVKYAARAHTYLARHDLRVGDVDEARRRLERALEILPSAELDEERTTAVALLGIVFVRLGEPDRARECWEEAAAWARRTGSSPSILGGSLNNLGRLEMAVGDPGVAASRWSEAEAVLRDAGRDRAAVIPAKNGALALAELGRYDEALAILQSQRDRSDENGWADLSDALRVDIAALERTRKRWPEAAARYRELLERVSEADEPELRASVVIGFTDVLSWSEGASEAADWLRSESLGLRARVDPKQRLDLDALLGWQLEQAGRHAEAEPILASCLLEADEAGWSHLRLRVAPALARSQRALGRSDDALATLRRGADAWESERDVPEDPVWRERRGALGADTFTELAALLVAYPPTSSAEERCIAAYEAVQSYKTRTLLERMKGPSAGSWPASAPLEMSWEERRALVPPGSVLLECVAGPRVSWLFAVSADTVLAYGLPAAEDALAALQQYRGLLHDAPASDAWRECARFVRETVLADVLGTLPSAARIFWAADGPWHLLPLATVPVEGEPLLARHEIVRIPSLEVLARVRRESAAPPSAHVVAITGALDAQGRPLPGAEREVASLERRFRDVEIRRGRAAFADGVHGVLHVAAHAEVDDGRPWRSGFALGSAGGPDEWLRAGDVAQSPLDARLAVLSGCETAGGRVLSGEGVLGLTGAFLAAGVSSVVSSTWPVRDQAVVDLMRTFYDRLARGEPVAAALRGAQLERSRAGAPPSEWAAFVVVGDGDLVLPIERRRGVLAPGVWFAVGILGLFAAWRLRARSNVAEVRPSVVP